MDPVETGAEIRRSPSSSVALFPLTRATISKVLAMWA
jgi:hypothetical protein